MTTGIETSWILIIGFGILAVGVMVGIAIGYLGMGDSRKAQELQEKLDQLQQEFNQYRDRVSSHFMQTSELVQKMTSSYREVYEHLASGSEELCATPVDTPQLDFPDEPALQAKPEPSTGEQAGSGPKPVLSEVTGPVGEEDNDEILGDAPKVPDLELEIPVGRTADQKT